MRRAEAGAGAGGLGLAGPARAWDLPARAPGARPGQARPPRPGLQPRAPNVFHIFLFFIAFLYFPFCSFYSIFAFAFSSQFFALGPARHVGSAGLKPGLGLVGLAGPGQRVFCRQIVMDCPGIQSVNQD